MRNFSCSSWTLPRLMLQWPSQQLTHIPLARLRIKVPTADSSIPPSKLPRLHAVSRPRLHRRSEYERSTRPRESANFPPQVTTLCHPTKRNAVHVTEQYCVSLHSTIWSCTGFSELPLWGVKPLCKGCDAAERQSLSCHYIV